ncbi:hypothetical protein JQ557_26800 [Bradyrhizobium sp. U87765 SZCCT0131]|uniref:hypothetical protein n=1 Tax=unclassified Bradyrhizobium TaxID=2631580 RepID=UPI001BACA527|nr:MULTISPECIES: hypothetical protein [unclassified Bradyrhizobium]MBR1221638.1 hypothetical protein [Bradyrhizobium sp. U87765 SZCCT0131]MBR1264439.1 hypothetical protein [Bradyrhizobium sp. U87765 SZCCT0134]MBR1304654.1 hypothetical protein [Bradyrhizobium sp. U87765 SZCCT0110]MBR1322489.1 hypothetical protein [Bradyrhizobium sp. U87765 SZCCT0109]MBR1346583.1 hypothetical protein [Bradyrhizobium sp. U87765 SZCCT0048]
MNNAFEVFVDCRAAIKRLHAQLVVGGVMLAATLLVLARVVTCLAAQADLALETRVMVLDMTVTTTAPSSAGCDGGRVSGQPEARAARLLLVCRG